MPSVIPTIHLPDDVAPQDPPVTVIVAPQDPPIPAILAPQDPPDVLVNPGQLNEEEINDLFNMAAQ